MRYRYGPILPPGVADSIAVVMWNAGIRQMIGQSRTGRNPPSAARAITNSRSASRLR
jgi:hypothetical protein